MHAIKAIRSRIGATQQAMASGIGCSQGNIANYERGQNLPPEAARKVIEYAESRGLTITFDHVYGEAPLPDFVPDRTPSATKESA